jgi:hypothetical protein
MRLDERAAAVVAAKERFRARERSVLLLQMQDDDNDANVIDNRERLSFGLHNINVCAVAVLIWS